MRPYLAILKDSFREAMASRVLLILFILATLALLLIAPISLTEKPRTQFRNDDFLDVSVLAVAIRRQATAEDPTPGKRIAKFANLSIRPKQDSEGNDDSP